MADMDGSRLETAVIHAGEEERIRGAIVQPIFQSSTFEYQGESSYEDLRYIRLNNTPNHLSLQAKLATLEKGESALVTSSGMAAISATLLTFLEPGDHLLAQDCLYGGTKDFITDDLRKMGVEVDFFNAGDASQLSRLLRDNTRLVYGESISNPLIQIGDPAAISAFAARHNLISAIDNTFATPLNFRPLEHGFDLVIHSCTKYLNGHTDLVAGTVIGSKEHVARINRKLLHLGGCLDPHACFLLNRGIKTMVLRVAYQNQSARRLAEFLDAHPAVDRVYYPSLASAGIPDRVKELFSGFGGMLSFELRDGASAASFLSSLRFIAEAPSLGGVESLVTRPATTSHSGMAPEEREKLGITESLIRLSVGIEATEDLIEDLGSSLQALT